MTDPTPDPARLGTEAEAPAPRRRFVLARLAGAVRRQDWFTVLVEIAIVVLGVVIGFQVTAWGQGRADAAKEQGYLVQLEEDLHETLRRVEEAEAQSAPRLRAGSRLVRGYRTPEPPPQDSVFQWLFVTFNATTVEPVVATAEALVATGDLALVRDDSLRWAVPAYLSQTRTTLSSQSASVEGLRHTFEDATRFMDFWDVYSQNIPQAIIDSVAQVNDASGIPGGPRTRPFPVRPADLLRDREAYRVFYLEHVWQFNLQSDRHEMREDAERLLALARSARGLGPGEPAPPDTTARRQ